jgi:short-subunit dehydrogenase
MGAEKGTVVVTGAGKGLGRALCIELWNMGYSLAIVARTESDLVSLKEEIQSEDALSQSENISSKKVTVHVIDISIQQQVATEFLEVFEAHPKVVGLVNNAGTWTGGKKAFDLEPVDFEKAMSLNFFSAVYVTHEVLQNFQKSSSSFLTIINVGATASVCCGPWAATFGAAKAALRAYSQSLARELSKEGVHVAHLVIDGLIDNPRTKALNPGFPNERFMNCKSISRTIVRVLEEEASCWTFEWDVRPNLAEW